MIRRVVLSLSAITVLGFALLAGGAVAQQKLLKEQLVGTWTFASHTGKRADGSPRWGTNPRGLLIFTAEGRYSLALMNPEVPKFASNNRLRGTAEEYKAAFEGSEAHFGRYSVNEAERTLTFHIESSTFPNSRGTEGKRPIIIIAGDELKYTNPAPAAGGAPTEVGWRRAK